MLVEFSDTDTKNWMFPVLLISATAPIVSRLSSERSFLNLQAASIAMRAFFSNSEFPITNAPIMSNPFGSNVRRSSAQIVKSKPKNNKKQNQDVELFILLYFC